MIFHPDVLAAHAQFGGDLESMQKLYEYPELKAEVERLRAAKYPAPAENVELPQDVINLVIAAREGFDTGHLPDDESRALDKALEPFASKVRYANEPDDEAAASEGSADV